MPFVARLLLSLGLQLLAGGAFAGSPSARWTMINVNGTEKQGDAHLLELGENGLYLIDCGSREVHSVVDYLARRKITFLDKVFLTHLHEDHYGGLLAILDAGVRVGEVYFNMPTRELCKKEEPWGCEYPVLLKWEQTLRARGTRIRKIAPGTVYASGKVQLDILYVYTPDNAPVPLAGINDMSPILLLRVGRTRALLTGDLDRGLGRHLTRFGTNLRADLLKVPHHGTEGTAENEFFDVVSPRIALVPSPRGLWSSERSRRLRRYFSDKKIPTYVNGVDGEVSVLLRDEEFCVETQNVRPFSLVPKCFRVPPLL